MIVIISKIFQVYFTTCLFWLWLVISRPIIVLCIHFICSNASIVCTNNKYDFNLIACFSCVFFSFLNNTAMKPLVILLGSRWWSTLTRESNKAPSRSLTFPFFMKRETICTVLCFKCVLYMSLNWLYVNFFLNFSSSSRELSPKTKFSFGRYWEQQAHFTALTSSSSLAQLNTEVSNKS